ncbi:hypothetical protein K8Z61_11475 [Nocardioides sp. TRM66260-LWL]|uniref:hypothetical protein n=1 Tax=Nocardioides sp. TRM66260-LWL TaxID=2874478 RepID=UPI001CC5FCDD|nr:hypothetical protein [Nocardioides sp. TRM66260-LWL]MBZ5735119.1 hypothetical protein [Nocardioides sp. TRM66260-LWL]
MSDAEQPEQPEQPSAQRDAEWRRRRRLAEVFGDVEPATTSDERDPRDAAAPRDADAWLREQVPPHHGPV